MTNTSRVLQSGSEVNRIPHHRVLAELTSADASSKQLTSVDTDAHLQVDVGLLLVVLALVESDQLVLQRQRGAHGALWIVRVGNWGPEEHHHRVPNVFVDVATKAGDRGS